MDNAIAIITARGGSRRIPKKNIKMFCGKPIIAYSIEAAFRSGIFSEVMVSTDSEEIAEIAREYGASVPFMRSAQTADDYATTADVLLEVLDQYNNIGKKFTYMCCIYPTAPFVTGDKLKEALNLLKENGSIEAMPMVAFSYPPQRAFIIKEGYAEYKEKKYIKTRSQDLEKIYHDAGQFYIATWQSFCKYNDFWGENTGAMILNELEVQDLDTEIDWQLAEMKYQLMKK